MREVYLPTSAPLREGDRVVINAELELHHDLPGVRVQVIGFRWEPIYADPPATASEGKVSFTKQ